MKRSAPVLAGIAAATLLTGIAAVVVPTVAGAIPNDGRIYACYSNTGGALRVVDEGTPCRRSERPLSWSQEGSGGTAPSPSMYYTVRNYDAQDSGVDLATTMRPLLRMSLPEPGTGESYLLTATFTLVNKSDTDLATAADAGLICNLGNLMGISDQVVPANGVSALGPDAGGMYSSNRRTFTLTGISDYNQASLECAIGNSTAGRDVPNIRFVGGYLTAQKVSGTQLANEASVP
jgi:hypothetical protein